MNRQQKESFVKLLAGDYSKSQAVFLVGFRGMTVEQLQKLRRQLRQNGGHLKVAKMTLVQRMLDAQDSACEALTPYLKNQCALVFADKDVSSVAKALHTIAKENERLTLVAGCFESQLLSSEAIIRIASLPSREVLLAKLCGTIQAPTSNLVGLLHAHVLRTLLVLKQIEKQKGVVA